MTHPIAAVLDIGLVFSIPLGLAIWQLVVLKRSIRRDRKAAERRTDDAVSPPPRGVGPGVGVAPHGQRQGHPAAPTSPHKGEESAGGHAGSQGP
ncbi:hypothetical protein ASG59_18915 [Methylobacterium sp. Leaf466]|nr:hypothetical protein ASG59_18915 [Methylobacterium sp. Leaf466]